MFGFTNGLTKCASSKLFALEENPFLYILVNVIPKAFMYNGQEGRAHLNLDSGLPHEQ